MQVGRTLLDRKGQKFGNIHRFCSSLLIGDKVSRLAENIDRVKARIEAIRTPSQSVTLVAVSKNRDASEIRQAFSCGIDHFGENYLQEALPKISELSDLPLTWHFIGSIQSNKTREIAEHFDWVQTLDRVKIAQRLSQQRPADLPPLQVCVQVNIDDEASKSGITPGATREFCAAISALPGLTLRGLMAIPAPSGEVAGQTSACLRMANLFHEVRQDFADVDTLSLGMSDDLETAIRAGSTMVRVGTRIFGPRN